MGEPTALVTLAKTKVTRSKGGKRQPCHHKKMDTTKKTQTYPFNASILISRIRNFCTFPVTVIGNSSTKRK